MRMWKLFVWTFIFATAATLSPVTVAWERPPTFVDLSYPAEALAARVAGTVVVRVTTDPSGRVVEAEALSGPAALRPGVVANIRQWTLAAGQRTDTLVYRFEIEHGACNDDSRSLFRLVQPNLAVVTACTGPKRAHAPDAEDEVPIASYGTPPPYPMLARSARFTGVVILDLSIDATGAVTASRALNNQPLLSHVAVEHSKSWRVRTTSARRGIVVYEFALDNPVCEPDDRLLFRRISSDYVRLSACEPPVNVNGGR
jgi:hypothetical protein